MTAYRSQIMQVGILGAFDPPVSSSLTPPMAVIIVRGGARNFPTGGADSSDEGAKIWFSGYYKC